MSVLRSRQTVSAVSGSADSSPKLRARIDLGSALTVHLFTHFFTFLHTVYLIELYFSFYLYRFMPFVDNKHCSL